MDFGYKFRYNIFVVKDKEMDMGYFKNIDIELQNIEIANYELAVLSQEYYDEQVDLYYEELEDERILAEADLLLQHQWMATQE